MPGRSSVSSAEFRYRFTGKERDVNETGWDYFGARYYDSRIGRWLGVDPKSNQLPSYSPYNYTRNNPIIRIDPDGKKDYKITMRTYIPFENALNFVGDNRGPRQNGGTYRTEQIVRIETNPNVKDNPLISHSANTGVTMMITPNGIVSSKSDPSGKFNADVMRTENNNGDNATINLSGSASNPLVLFAPAIDYNINISIMPGQNGESDNVEVKGTHDGFPAYEIWVESDGKEGKLIYNYTPGNNSTDMLKLYPPEDVNIKKD